MMAVYTQRVCYSCDVCGRLVEAEDDNPEKRLNEGILQFNDSEGSNYY